MFKHHLPIRQLIHRWCVGAAPVRAVFTDTDDREEELKSVYICLYICVCVCVCMLYTCEHLCVYFYIFVCAALCASLCMPMCAYVCVFVYLLETRTII